MSVTMETVNHRVLLGAGPHDTRRDAVATLWQICSGFLSFIIIVCMGGQSVSGIEAMTTI